LSVLVVCGGVDGANIHLMGIVTKPSTACPSRSAGFIRQRGVIFSVASANPIPGGFSEMILQSVSLPMIVTVHRMRASPVGSALDFVTVTGDTVVAGAATGVADWGG
jgi:hypothetical protein